MDIRLLNSSFRPSSAPIDGFLSHIWTRNYYSADEYSLYVVPSCLNMVQTAKYVYNAETQKSGIIENISAASGDSGSLVVRGRGLEALLEKRIITRDYTAAGVNLINELTALVTEFATGSRALCEYPLIVGSNNIDSIITDIAYIYGETLSAFLYRVLTPFEASYSLDYREPEGVPSLIFTIYKGLDRTSGQSINSRAVFSTSVENIKNPTYSSDNTAEANYFYVSGAADAYGDIPRITVDRVPEGAERKEAFIDCSDVSWSDAEGYPYTDAEYNELLATAADEKIREFSKNETLEATASGGNLKFGVNYSLGDLCEVSAEAYGVLWQKRVESVIEVWESGGHTIEPKFGAGRKTVADLLKKKITKTINGQTLQQMATVVLSGKNAVTPNTIIAGASGINASGEVIDGIANSSIIDVNNAAELLALLADYSNLGNLFCWRSSNAGDGYLAKDCLYRFTDHNGYLSIATAETRAPNAAFFETLLGDASIVGRKLLFLESPSTTPRISWARLTNPLSLTYQGTATSSATPSIIIKAQVGGTLTINFTKGGGSRFMYWQPGFAMGYDFPGSVTLTAGDEIHLYAQGNGTVVVTQITYI